MGHVFVLSLLLLTATPQVQEQVIVTAKDGNLEKTESINKETVDQYTLLNTGDLFSFFPSLSLETRGPGSIQADISYRGARGNQVGILLNGVPMNNPQTYHHNFDIPVAPEDLVSFSVQPSTSGTGDPYAFSGQVNLVTGDNRRENYNFAYGTDRYYHIYAAEQGLSYLLEGSKGYRENTDFHNTNVTWQGQRNGIHIFTAFNKKRFGAQDFYAPYPSLEDTQTYLVSSTWKNMTVYGIRHDDTFILDRNQPDFYRNDHTTYKAGFKQDFQFGNRYFISYDVSYNNLDSSNLGQQTDHQVLVKGAMLFQPGNWLIRPGITYVDSSRDSGQIMPFITMFRRFGVFDLSLDASRTVRLPDYTELYYTSPVNAGNPDLKPEESWNADLTIGYRWLSTTAFYRSESNLIDWVRRDTLWHAENIGQSQVWGLELKARIKNWSVGYQMVSRTRDTEMETKYTYYTPKNRWVLRYASDQLSFVYQFLDTPKLSNASVLNVTFFGTGFYLKVQNALDDSYQTLPGIPMPGRSYIIGYRVNGPLFNE